MVAEFCYNIRQTRFIVSHQPLDLICVWVGSYYSLLNFVASKLNNYAWQTYGATAINSGYIITWNVIMTVEVAGLKGGWY